MGVGWLVGRWCVQHVAIWHCYLLLYINIPLPKKKRRKKAGTDKLDGRVDDTSVSWPCVLFWQGCIRIASAMAAMARLSRIWRYNTISFTSKFRFYKSLVTSILLFGCEI